MVIQKEKTLRFLATKYDVEAGTVGIILNDLLHMYAWFCRQSGGDLKRSGCFRTCMNTN